MIRKGVYANIVGEGALHDNAGYEVEHVADAGGQEQIIRLTVDLGGLQLSLDFNLEGAEEFIVRVRDAVVRAHQARLEWETDTDPETGVVVPEEGER